MLLQFAAGESAAPALSGSEPASAAHAEVEVVACERSLTYGYRHKFSARDVSAVASCARDMGLIPLGAALVPLGWRRLGFSRTATAEFTVQIEGVRVAGAVITLLRPADDSPPQLRGSGSLRNARWRSPVVDLEAALASAQARNPGLAGACGAPSSELAYRAEYAGGAAQAVSGAMLVPEWRLVYCSNNVDRSAAYVVVDAVTGAASDARPYDVPEAVEN